MNAAPYSFNKVNKNHLPFYHKSKTILEGSDAMKWKNFDSSWTRKIGFSQAIIPSVLPDKDHISKQLNMYTKYKDKDYLFGS